MKNKLNIIFFGICFLAALIGEIYCILILDGDLFSTIGIGLVVLITGFLFMETIQSKIETGRENTKFYIDHILQEENEKWVERYTQLIDLQKATYTATKKNSAKLENQFDELKSRLEEIETNNSKALQKIIELLKKSMEGQKNALNLEINHSRENTKQIIEAIRKEEKSKDSEQLTRILELLEENRNLLSSKDISIKENAPELLVSQIEEQQSEASDFTDIADYSDDTDNINNTLNGENAFNIDNTLNINNTLNIENMVNDDYTVNNEYTVGSDYTVNIDNNENMDNTVDMNNTVDAEKPESIKVTPLYDDPNKNLSADEIAALFASIGK